MLTENAFAVKDRELDDCTRTRNTVALSAAVCWQIISHRNNSKAVDFQLTLNLLVNYLRRERLFFWGEGALSQFAYFIWMLERGGQDVLASSLLLNLIGAVADRNSRLGENPYEDPYVSPDECLVKMFETIQENNPPRRQVVESYSLLPLIILAVRRSLRGELEKIWKPITDVSLTRFRSENADDALLWHCEKGSEYSESFARPQSWNELHMLAFRDDLARIPKVLQDDINFALLYSLVFQHRILLSLLKHLDKEFSQSVSK